MSVADPRALRSKACFCLESEKVPYQAVNDWESGYESKHKVVAYIVEAATPPSHSPLALTHGAKCRVVPALGAWIIAEDDWGCSHPCFLQDESTWHCAARSPERVVFYAVPLHPLGCGQRWCSIGLWFAAFNELVKIDQLPAEFSRMI